MSITKRRSFGSGLSAVLEIAATSIQEIESDALLQKELKSVFVHKILPGRFQPRRVFEPASLQELANSIKERGILQPIMVRKQGGDEYEIIAGERRWRAAQMAGLQQVPIIVCELDDQATLAFGLIENIQRKDLNPIEEAHSLKRLIDEFAMTHEQVSKAIGRSRVAVSNLLRLLTLTEPVKELINKGLLEMGHARALLGLSYDLQISAANQVVSKQLSVRQTEALVRQQNQIETQGIKIPNDFYVNKALEFKEKITQYFPSDILVKIKENGSGFISLNFTSLSEAEKIMAFLTGQE